MSHDVAVMSTLHPPTSHSQQLEALQAQIDRLQRRCDTVTTERDALSRDLSNSTTEISALKNENRILKSKLRDVEYELEEFRVASSPDRLDSGPVASESLEAELPALSKLVSSNKGKGRATSLESNVSSELSSIPSILDVEPAVRRSRIVAFIGAKPPPRRQPSVISIRSNDSPVPSFIQTRAQRANASLSTATLTSVSSKTSIRLKRKRGESLGDTDMETKEPKQARTTDGPPDLVDDLRNLSPEIPILEPASPSEHLASQTAPEDNAFIELPSAPTHSTTPSSLQPTNVDPLSSISTELESPILIPPVAKEEEKVQIKLKPESSDKPISLGPRYASWRDIPPLIITPAVDRSFGVTRVFLQKQYGLHNIRMRGRITGNTTSCGDRDVNFPTYKKNPALPLVPGKPGAVYSSRTDILGIASIFVASKRKGPPQLWEYFGDYRLEVTGPLKAEQFKAQSTKFQMDWASKILKSQESMGYVLMRTRVALRKHSKELSEANVEAEAEKIKGKKTGTLRITQDDVLSALRNGEEVR
ncbi:hypothetical protein VKT23_014949 [Stygiomarasmius scandens]|uniref:DUF6697 domain-containing protein n=1 Tax=Marasmiellus scandens TaxID=2682957 RepID=A0ABR1IZ61_9AGAR